MSQGTSTTAGAAPEANPLIDALPGVPLPVSEVNRMLVTLWDPDEQGPFGQVSEFRASQLNLVLHFGIETPPDEARARFNAAIRFSQRYPSRIIVLCPQREAGLADGTPSPMRGKLFSQCYIGTGGQDMVCCESLMLGFSQSDTSFLENQASVWLEADLPVYHWLHRVPPERIDAPYRSFLSRCRRVVLDREIDPDLLSGVLPEPERVRELAHCRLLPLRQAIGQYLSKYQPADLVKGLQTVRITAPRELTGEVRALLDWTGERLAACLRPAGLPAADTDWAFEAVTSGEADTLSMEWLYEGGEDYFRLCADFAGAHGRVAVRLAGGPPDEFTIRIRRLELHQALAEAFFF